jgi:hypothetical protein
LANNNVGDSIAAAVDANATANNNGDGIGIIIVQRYQGVQSNAHAALCNAAQDPGEEYNLI